MEGPGGVGGEKFVGGREGEVAFALVIRADFFAAETKELAVGQERAGEGLAEVAVGQAGDGDHGGEGCCDGGGGDNEGGAGAGESEFGEAEDVNSVVGPERGGVVENDPGEGVPVGVVDNERDVVPRGEVGEAAEFVVGNDVAAGVGRTGNAEGGDVGGEVQGVEVDVVFKACGPVRVMRGRRAAKSPGSSPWLA